MYKRQDSGNDTLNGGSGNDLLYGGTGDDFLSGGIGDDSYYIDSTSDTITENPSEGTDKVYSSVNFKLSSNLENLKLTGSSEINGNGNEFSNFSYLPKLLYSPSSMVGTSSSCSLKSVRYFCLR